MIARGLNSILAAVLATLFLTAAAAAPAQNPTPQAGAPGDAVQRPRRQVPTPVNLQVLPKDTSGEQVIQIMRHFTGDLGVECSFCHAKDPATSRMDFPSDANPMKNTARVMMRMTHTINATYLTQLTVPNPAQPVTCGTCHHGMADPPAFVPQQRERGPRPPAPGTTPAPSAPPPPPGS